MKGLFGKINFFSQRTNKNPLPPHNPQEAPEQHSIKTVFARLIEPFRRKNPEELEFMSNVHAAQLYQGSPTIYYLSFAFLLIFIAFILWTVLTERNEVTQGSGQIIPSQGVQPVQSERGGIIKEILVSENEAVEKETLLVIISNIQVLGEFQELSNRKVENELALQRLHAEQADEELVFSEQQITQYPKAVEDQLSLFVTRKEKYEGEIRQLKAILEQRKLELSEAYQRREQYEQSLLLLKQQEARILPLLKNKSYSQVEYLNLKQRIVSMESDLKTLAVNIVRTISAVNEAEDALKNIEPERQGEIAKEINKYRQELNSISERLKAGTDAVQRSELRSVVKGTIKRILLNEEAVVRPAELIMEIVPTEDALEVEAKFKPASRGFLETGQSATVKISAYDSTIYGTLSATVASISPDTIEDSRGEPWYLVRLRTNSTKLPYADKDLDIKSGMTVTVDVISGKKSIFSYLIKPFFKARQQGSALGQAVPPASDH